ncbi:MAG: asparagine synthase (glutamine-hydrolyzing) [Sporomusaceae bacterium]|nr:asparagine synthase (glutamine-hydrolyzing) [Sporomusaceae bacterium]
MCGITGWVDWQRPAPEQERLLLAMMDTLAVRGPDAAGFYVKGHAALGHRRLSVVDLVGGAQPMICRRGEAEYAITYNGELYNTLEIKRELEAKGHSFMSHSDTEVLLHAYIEWREGCLEKFNGIFAFAIWDDQAQELFIARDRIGVKPFFYALNDKRLLFASEVKALLQHPDVAPRVGKVGLAEILLMGPARTPGQGIYEGISELKPGFCGRFSQNGLEVYPYWQLISARHEDTFAETTVKVRELVTDAVIRQLVADVPVCAFLSGGLDSSALTAIAAEKYRQEKRVLGTYSVDYIDNEQFFTANDFQPNSDAPWVEKMQRFVQTDHHKVLLSNEELASTLGPATIARDFPGMADVDTSLYLFCREIRKGATVALSGECADEIFGGYPWFQRPDMIEAATFPWANHLDYRAAFLKPEIRDYLEPEKYVQDRYEEALAEVSPLAGEERYGARMREIFYLSLTRFMPTLLDRKDRMSMAFGLEVRVPYCDHRIVEYVWNVPWQMKYHQKREKGLLRQALQGILPDDVLWRRKSPYPKTHHPGYYELVKNQLLSLLKDPLCPLHQLIDSEKLFAYAAQNETGPGVPWFGQLMTKAQLFAYFLQVYTWLTHYQVKIV